jgi:hypothetical protein
MGSTALQKHTWGGARIGAGAPVSSRTLETQRMREMMLKRLKPRVKELFDALMDSAIGLRVTKEADGGDKEFVYSKAPDVGAAKLLLEYTLGKPKEQIEHAGGMSLFHLVSSLEEQTKET